jgi:hypothetical protein
MKTPRQSPIVAAALLLLSVIAVRAQDSDAIVAYGPNGNILRATFIPETSPETPYIFADAAPNPQAPGPLVLVEPDGGISDIFGLAVTPNTPNGKLAFVSDGENPLSRSLLDLFPGTPVVVKEQEGHPYDVTAYFASLPQGVAAVKIVSDGDAVPDAGATGLMLGGALAGLTLIRRRS